MKSTMINSFKLIHDLSKVFGLLPVKIILHQNGTWRGDLYLRGIIYGIALAMFMMGAQFWGLYRDLRDGWENSSRLNSITSIVVTGCDLYATISPFIFAILLSPYRWIHLKRAMYKIIEVDKALKEIETSKNLWKLSISLILATMVPTLIFSSADFVMWAFWIEPKDWGGFGLKGHINFLPLYFMKITTLVMELQIATVILNVSERFDKINSLLENLTRVNVFNKYFRKDFAWATPKKQKHPIISAVPSQRDLISKDEYGKGGRNTYRKSTYDDPEKLIDQLITLHSTMCNCVDSVNKAYGLTMLTIALSHLLYFTIHSYLLLVYSFKWYIVADQVFWLLFYICSLILFVQPCHSMAEKAKMTGKLVSRSLLQDWDPEVELQLETFSNLLMRRRVEITACGLFTIDRGLIGSIVGTVTTYLVILLQSDGKGSNQSR